MSLGETGLYAALARNRLRGSELCVNEKGGVLGRKLQLVVEDDQSKATVAVGIYDRLIGQYKVDLTLGPISSPLVDAVANVAERYHMPMVAPGGAATSIFKKGRRFVFQVLSPSETWLEGFVELAARHGPKTIALINERTLFPRTVVEGAAELAKKKGLQVVFTEAYPRGTTDFSAILGKVRAAAPDAFAAATYVEDAIAISRQLKQLDVNVKMYALTVGVTLPRFYEELGRTAEFVYGPSEWEPELVTLRAGGLIPIARQYPGAREFVEAHDREYPDGDLSYNTAAGYAGC